MAVEQTQQMEQAPDAPELSDDSSILADLARLTDDGEEPAAEEQTGDTTEDGPDVEVEAAESDEEAEAEEPSEDDETADRDEPAEDPELAKRLEKIQRQEQRSKELVAQQRRELEQERAAFAKEREEWAPKVERFEQLASRAKYDPASVLTELGLGEEDLEPAARQLYALSKAGKADPKLREQAARSQREREMMSELESLKKQMAEREKRDAEREQQAAAERQANEYLQTVEKAVGTDSVLVGRMLERTPQKARAQLRQVAAHLLQETGEVPDPVDVVAQLEKIRRAELEELGLEIPVAGKKAASKTSSPAKANENAMAKTLRSDLGTQTNPRAESPRDEDIDEQILRDLKAGILDE